MRLLLSTFLIAFGVASAGAQRVESREVFGSVQGRVVCADTNQPARLATITLQQMPEEKTVAGKTEVVTPGLTPEDKPVSAGLSQYRTRLDGSFTVPRVPPGRYYVVVQAEGYLSPVTQFTIEDISHPLGDVKDEIARLIPVVTVKANESSSLEVRLRRGASLSGAIRYDDGTAAAGLGVSIRIKGKSGKWTRAAGVYSQTDDQGRFRAAGLGEGEYRISTSLEIDRRVVSAVFGGSRMSTSKTGYSLDFYDGDTFREKEAKTRKLGEGEETSGVNLTIPLNRLHSVSGKLVGEGSGRTINAGKVQLFYAEDNTSLVSAELDHEDPTFHFDFVPEGNYTVRVDDAREVTWELEPAAKGDVFAQIMPQYKPVTVTTYGKYEGALQIQTDLTGVVLTVPPAKPK